MLQKMQNESNKIYNKAVAHTTTSKNEIHFGKLVFFSLEPKDTSSKQNIESLKVL